jgi:hypothetical protein
MASGNNLRALKIERIIFPIFNNDTGFATAGEKYFFPENPQIDNKQIVGIEVHCGNGAGRGDLQGFAANKLLTTAAELGNIYLTFVDNDKNEIFENVPAISIFGRLILGASPKQKIYPFFGKIKTRNCFAYIPANTGLTFKDIHLTLTFYMI